MREKLLQLLRCALWGHSYTNTISAKEFQNLLHLADVQTVFGLVFGALKDTQIDGMEDKMPIYEAVGILEQIQQQNSAINKEILFMCNAFRSERLDYIVVKGQTLGCLYPHPSLRQSGDIDFLVRDNYQIAKAKTEKALDVTLSEKILEKEVGFDRNDVRYELHTRLRGWAKKRHQKMWDQLIEQEWQSEYYVEIESVKVRTLSPTLNAAYVFIHLFFHFIREGVSLRQFCDWAIILHYFNDEIDRKELAEILSNLDMMNSYKAFGSILVDELGLPINYFPFTIADEDRKWKEKILRDIFAGGNFGILNHHANSSWKYKFDTMGIVLRNTIIYYNLCPSEVGGMIPRLLKGNLIVLFHR